MNKNKGWIKVHRSIMDNWIYDNPWTFKGFLHLCMTVNVSASTADFDGKIYTLQPGQRITSVQTLSTETGFAWKTTDKILQQFEEMGMIRMDQLGKAFILTVVNFKKYQSLTSVRDEVRDDIRDDVRNEVRIDRSEVRDEVRTEVRQIKKDKNIENNTRSKRSKEGAQRRLNLWEGAPEE